MVMSRKLNGLSPLVKEVLNPMRGSSCQKHFLLASSMADGRATATRTAIIFPLDAGGGNMQKRSSSSGRMLSVAHARRALAFRLHAIHPAQRHRLDKSWPFQSVRPICVYGILSASSLRGPREVGQESLHAGRPREQGGKFGAPAFTTRGKSRSTATSTASEGENGRTAILPIS